MAEGVNIFPVGTKFCVIVDMDGTLTNASHRQHLASSPDKNFKAFYNRCGDDPIHQHIAVTVGLLSSLYEIVVVTGRPEEYRGITAYWLAQHQVKSSALYMRSTGDYRSDDIVKEEILDRDILPRYAPVMALDDRDRVVAMWRRRGIPCLQVAPGDF